MKDSTNNKAKKGGGLLVGILMIIIGSIVLVHNEKNNVANIKSTDEMRKVVIDVSSDEVKPENDGKLVATSGQLDIVDTDVSDYRFNVSKKTTRLKRNVEVYQWIEEKEESDDKTTYTYSKEWSDKIVDSSNFNESSTHTNPSVKTIEDESFIASTVFVGAYNLSSKQKENIPASKEMNLEGVEGIYLPSDYYINGKYITSAKDMANPEVGDVRVYYTYNDYETVSILAQQSGNTFTEYLTKAGKSYNRIVSGKLTGSQIISKIEGENKALKWGLRIGGAFIIILGYISLFAGLNRLLSYIPILGKIAAGIINFIAGLIGFVHSLVIIIIAWFRYRPLLCAILLVVIVGLVILIRMKKKQGQAAAAQTAPVQPVQPVATPEPVQPAPVTPVTPVEPVQPAETTPVDNNTENKEN